VSGKLLEPQDSGSASPPRTTATSGASRRHKKLHWMGRSGTAASPLPFLAGSDLYKQQNRNNQFD